MSRDLTASAGDLARWLPDGTIDFIGRMDTQVCQLVAGTKGAAALSGLLESVHPCNVYCL